MVYLNARLGLPPINVEGIVEGAEGAASTAGSLLKPSVLAKILPSVSLSLPLVTANVDSSPDPTGGNSGTTQGSDTGSDTGGSDSGGNTGGGNQGSGNNGGATTAGGQTTAGNGSENAGNTGDSQPTNTGGGNSPPTITGTKTTTPQSGQTEGGQGNGTPGAQPTQPGSVPVAGGGRPTSVPGGSTNIQGLPLSAAPAPQFPSIGGQRYVTVSSSEDAQAFLPATSTPTVFATYSLVTFTDSAGIVHTSTSMFTSTSYVAVPTPTSTSASNAPRSSSPAGLIGGLVAGIVILLIFIALAIRHLLRKRRTATRTISFDKAMPDYPFTGEGATSYPGTPTSLEFAIPQAPSPMVMVASKSRSSLVSNLIASVRKRPESEDKPDPFLSASRRSSASFGPDRWSSSNSLVSRSTSFRSLDSVQEEENVAGPSATHDPFADPKPREHEKGIESDPFADPSPIHNHPNSPT
ncbi:hypothetical protein Moror_7316 [Moniliophthora roreri MCA 2997]|uniref:Uncharacterized protein n=1 Tax=Moniliophthora roreri (strain MCA 2997) TaxID=1381753 RepID=V2XUI3_MONRO|nr:hypothetical protein Moror_7316 [Moniliophthora roreri MCA 2997]